MALKIGNVFINEDDLIPVIVKASTEIDTYVKGYHVYKNIWKPTVNKELETEMEPDNVMDKYAVCVKKNTSIVGHLPLGKNFFFKYDPINNFLASLSNKPVENCFIYLIVAPTTCAFS